MKQHNPREEDAKLGAIALVVGALLLVGIIVVALLAR